MGSLELAHHQFTKFCYKLWYKHHQIQFLKEYKIANFSMKDTFQHWIDNVQQGWAKRQLKCT